jgi:hypothetical protein
VSYNKALNAYGSLACKIPWVKKLRQDLGLVAENPYHLILLFLQYNPKWLAVCLERGIHVKVTRLDMIRMQ